MPKAALLTAGIVFLLVALLHLPRIFTHIPVIVNGHEVPFMANGIGFVVSGLLSFWMFKEAMNLQR